MKRLLTLTLASLSIVVLSCGGSSQGSGSSGGACTNDPAPTTCDGAACGGDIVGTWKLLKFCGASCVTSVADVVTFGADGTYSGGGTWKYSGSNSVTTTVGTASSGAAYCVTGDILWLQRGTNCGPGQGDSITSVRRRDCGGTTTTPDAGR